MPEAPFGKRYLLFYAVVCMKHAQDEFEHTSFGKAVVILFRCLSVVSGFNYRVHLLKRNSTRPDV